VIHPEEHTLERFLLEDPDVAAQRAAIESHLAGCAGCRDLVASMHEFYEQFAAESNAGASALPPSSRALSPTRPDIALEEPFRARAVHRPDPGPMERLRFFVVRYPLAVGGGAFAMLAGLALLGNALVGRLTTDRNPAYVHLNPGTRMFAVYNRSNEKIWERPLGEKGMKFAVLEDDKMGWKAVQVTDLDNDGMNEVISIIPMPGDRITTANVLRIFGEGGRVRLELPFAEPCTFRGRPYEPTNGIATVRVTRENEGPLTMLLLAGTGRSPSLVARVDADGTRLGEYWHFGGPAMMELADLDGDGREELVLGLTNDVEDDSGGNFEALVVLDPSKISGSTESRLTPGFGMAPSEAELAYIRLPRSDISYLISPKGAVRSFHWQGDSTERRFSFWSTGSYGGSHPMFEYVFRGDLTPVAVRRNDITAHLYAQLVAEGRLKGVMDEAYMEALKSGIRYFDGSAWTATPTWMGRGHATIP
jgi:hypothetical protein